MVNDKLTFFETLFKTHFEPLCHFAQKYVSDVDDAKGVVHEVFVVVWEKFDQLDGDINYRSYLYTAVRNRCLNVIRDSKKLVNLTLADEIPVKEEHNTMEVEELEASITFAMNTLPEKCKEVFELSRVEGLKYNEIAIKLNISIKTVEAQMSKALRILREHLKDFMIVLFFLGLR